MSDTLNEQLKSSGLAQVIVTLKRPGDSAAAANSLRGHFRLGETAPQTAMAAALSDPGRPRGEAAGAAAPKAMRIYQNLGIMLGTVDRAGLAALRADKANVARVTGAPILSLIRPSVRMATAKPRTAVTWGVAALEANAVWKRGYDGSDVLVGHLDTGVDGQHPALRGAIADFAEFDGMGNLVQPSPMAFDSEDHGTHTAATIVGRPVKLDGKQRHVGVAPGAKLVSALVIEGGDAIARVLGGMDWAVGKGVRVLNLSLGIRGYWSDFESVTRTLRDRGVLPVFAVGNEGAGNSRSPGNYVEAMSVGAVDRAGNVPEFSSSQRFSRGNDPLVPDLVAPGVDVISAAPGGGYKSMDGSSMATPHISGLAALLLQAKPTATPDEVEAAIYASCRGGGGMPQERANRGMPNGPRALAHLLG
jgi:subtilisin